MIQAAVAITPTLPGLPAKGASSAGGDLFALSMLAVGTGAEGGSVDLSPPAIADVARQNLAAPGIAMPIPDIATIDPALAWLPAVDIAVPAPLDIPPALASVAVDGMPTPVSRPFQALRGGASMQVLAATSPLVADVSTPVAAIADPVPPVRAGAGTAMPVPPTPATIDEDGSGRELAAPTPAGDTAPPRPAPNDARRPLDKPVPAARLDTAPRSPERAELPATTAPVMADGRVQPGAGRSVSDPGDADAVTLPDVEGGSDDLATAGPSRGRRSQAPVAHPRSTARALPPPTSDGIADEPIADTRPAVDEVASPETPLVAIDPAILVPNGITPPPVVAPAVPQAETSVIPDAPAARTDRTILAGDVAVPDPAPSVAPPVRAIDQGDAPPRATIAGVRDFDAPASPAPAREAVAVPAGASAPVAPGIASPPAETEAVTAPAPATRGRMGRSPATPALPDAPAFSSRGQATVVDASPVITADPALAAIRSAASAGTVAARAAEVPGTGIASAGVVAPASVAAPIAASVPQRPDTEGVAVAAGQSVVARAPRPTMPAPPSMTPAAVVQGTVTPATGDRPRFANPPAPVISRNTPPAPMPDTVPVQPEVPAATMPAAAAPATPVIAAAAPVSVAGAAILAPTPATEPRTVFVREVSGTPRQTVALRPQAAPSPQAAAGTTAPAAQVFGAAMHAVADSDDRKRAVPADPTSAAVAAPMPLRDAAPIAAAGQPTLDMRQESWPTTMIDHIEALRDAANANDTRIRLVPDALGTIDVAVRTVGDAIHVRFTAEDATTRAMLEDARPGLALVAEERGLKIGQTIVDPASATAGQSNTGQSNTGQSSSGQQQSTGASPSGGGQQQTAAQAQTGQQQPRQHQQAATTRQPASPARSHSNDGDTTGDGRVA